MRPVIARKGTASLKLGWGSLCWVALIAAAAGCGPSRQSATTDGGPASDSGPAAPDSAPRPHLLEGLLIEPTNVLVELDLGSSGSQAFTVTGLFQDGVNEDFTSKVTWTVDNPAVGTMTGATLIIPAFDSVTAVVSKIHASFEDLEGTAQITVVAYQKSGDEQDFFFTLPYQDTAGAQTKPLAFGTDIPSLDVFFLMDTTGSMLGEITNLQDALTGTVIPGIKAQVTDSQFGAGVSEDFPIAPYGNDSDLACQSDTYDEGIHDQPFKLFQAITSNTASTQTAVNKFSTLGGPIGCGGDWPEAHIESFYQIATGTGLTAPTPTSVPARTGGVGGVGFRQGTMPVIVAITDAASHAPGEDETCTVELNNGGTATYDIAYEGAVGSAAHTRAQAKNVLGNICARVVGISSVEPIASPGCQSLADLEDFATATGARVPPSAWDVGTRPTGCAAGKCCTDTGGTGRNPDEDGLCPVVFRTDNEGNGLGNHIVTGIQMLTRFATFDVTSEKAGGTTSTTGTALPGGHTTADFLDAVTPKSFVLPPPPPNLPNPTLDATAFHKVTPGTVVSFDVSAFNDFLPQTTEAQFFEATITVLAGGCTPLDERTVLILVPPAPVIVD